MKKLYFLVFAGCFLCGCSWSITTTSEGALTKRPKPPGLNNNPQFDMILTNPRPILSANNPKPTPDFFTVDFQLSQDPAFPADKTISYTGLKSKTRGMTQSQVQEGDDLSDGQYYWRARTIDGNGLISPWGETRFRVDVKNSRTFSGYLRAPVKRIEVSSGEDAKNIIDWNDQGQITYWNSAPSSGEPFSWVLLDMGKEIPVCRFWMLSTRSITPAAGWLKDFAWQSSNDLRNWQDIPGTKITGNDTYRNIIDFKPVNARYYRLVINSQNALQAQINVIIPYVKGQPKVPVAPDGKYVLIIGNQMNGYTYTNLVKFVQKHGYKALVIPHYEMSYAVLEKLKNKPMAIILSGNNADWQNLPMFEYYGEYEMVRKNYDIPMMGICAGNEFMAMSYGISFAHWMEWFDDTMFLLDQGKTPDKVHIRTEFANAPIFAGLPNPFQAVEIHSWAISPLFLKDKRYSEFVETAHSSYIQCIKSTKRDVYSEQFHGAVVNKYNQSGQYLANFLKIADKKASTRK